MASSPKSGMNCHPSHAGGTKSTDFYFELINPMYKSKYKLSISATWTHANDA